MSDTASSLLRPASLRALMHSGLFRQLFAWFLVMNLFVLLTSVVITRQLSNRNNTLEAISAEALREVQTALATQGPRGLEQLHDRWRRGRFINVYVFHDGHFIGNARVPQQVLDHLPAFDDSILQRDLRGGEQLRVMPIQFTVRDGSMQQGHLVLFRTLEAQSSWSLSTLLAIQIGVSLLAIVVVGALVARRFITPLQITQQTVARIGQGDLSTRVPATATNRSDEFGQLARGVNDMAVRIETLVNDRNRLLHDVSHEMRSPLARLRILLELARTDEGAAQLQQLNKADAEITRMDTLVEEVLSYARATHLAQHTATPPAAILLNELLATVVDSAQVEASAAQVQLMLLQTGTAGVIHCHAELLERAFDNLLRNAIRYSDAGTTVTVTLNSTPEQTTVSVQDQGPGIPDSEREHIFQPFVRIPGNERGKGYGLGLALVQRVADAHGAQVEARNLHPGLEVSLHFRTR